MSAKLAAEVVFFCATCAATSTATGMATGTATGVALGVAAASMATATGTAILQTNKFFLYEECSDKVFLHI